MLVDNSCNSRKVEDVRVSCESSEGRYVSHFIYGEQNKRRGLMDYTVNPTRTREPQRNRSEESEEQMTIHDR